MAKAVRIHETGGPDALVFEDVEVGAPGPGEALLRQPTIGLNFIDVYFRAGLYPAPSLPATLGGPWAWKRPAWWRPSGSTSPTSNPATG